MNILEINFSRAWGGLEMQMPIIARGLKDLGHNVIVVCPKSSPAENAAIQYGLEVINLENKIKYLDLFTICKLKNIIKENKIDVVHSHMAKDLWLIVPAARMAGCPKIYWTRHIESHYRKKDIFHFVLYRLLTGVIAITNAVRKTLIDTTYIPPEKIEVIYCGVDVGRLIPQRNILKEEYKIPEDYLLIGVVGRLQDGKGQEHVLRAAPAVLKKFPKLKVFMVGEETRGERTGYKDYLLGIVKELDMVDNVIFTGFRTDIPAVMSSLDMLILPSKREAFGLVVVEAMAVGKIVIATESPGTREIIDDGVDGFLVPYGNSEILAERILWVLSNRDSVDKIGEMARKKVEEKFNFSKNIRKLNERISP